MQLLKEFNKLAVRNYSVAGDEVEYILVDDTPENRKVIDLALASHFNWAIVSLVETYHLTAGGTEIIQNNSEGGFINLAGIIWEELPVNDNKDVVWHSKLGFSKETN